LVILSQAPLSHFGGIDLTNHKELPPILGKWDYILLMGESGSGKGTLVKNINKFWLPTLESASMGDIFREKAKTDPEIKNLTEQGALIGDDIVISIFKSLIEESTPALLDGFPRNRHQTLEAIKIFKDIGWRVLVIDLHCSIEVIIERLLTRGRVDDQLAIMHKRNVMHKESHPSVMAEIKNRADVFDIINLNGNRSIDVTFTDFLLEVLRLVDMLHLYDMPQPDILFKATEDETSVNNAINRWLSALLIHIDKTIRQ